jgi:N-acetyl-gamma-glutamyl-phosphate reductase
VKKISIVILGATSYTGVELVWRLSRHPYVSLCALSSQSYAGLRLSSVFPQLAGVCDEVLLDTGEIAGRAGNVHCVFSCLPHAVSAEHLLPFIDRGVRVVDLSADFRLRDAAVYERWYLHKHPRPALLSSAVYGLTELYRAEVKQAQVVANPGCYPTSVLLPLLPLLKQGMRFRSIVADSKSGVSGAGRTLKITSHFVEANENVTPYAPGRTHRHVPEMEQELGIAAGTAVRITFVPHLVPVSRGMLSTIYLDGDVTAEECERAARDAYAHEPFVRVRSDAGTISMSGVAHGNRCDCAFTGGKDGVPVIAVSALDNLVKGASGQALQNMNVMFGFTETLGLA